MKVESKPVVSVWGPTPNSDLHKNRDTTSGVKLLKGAYAVNKNVIIKPGHVNDVPAIEISTSPDNPTSGRLFYTLSVVPFDNKISVEGSPKEIIVTTVPY